MEDGKEKGANPRMLSLPSAVTQLKKASELRQPQGEQTLWVEPPDQRVGHHWGRRGSLTVPRTAPSLLADSRLQPLGNTSSELHQFPLSKKRKMIQSSYEEPAKQRKQRVKDLSQQVLGGYLNLGKKISAPQDVMMEELKLLTNRGSRMFHERLRRVDKFILENAGRASRKVAESSQAKRSELESRGEDGKGSFQTEVFIKQPGRNSLVSALRGTVAKNGSPDALAPGYAKPLKDIPHEKFNVTVIPKSYYSPWREDLSAGEKILATIHAHLPELPQKLTPANYKNFNRAPIPFSGTGGSVRTLPLPGFELALARAEPSLDRDRISRRPNFNRAPQGWGLSKKAESTEL